MKDAAARNHRGSERLSTTYKDEHNYRNILEVLSFCVVQRLSDTYSLQYIATSFVGDNLTDHCRTDW